LDQGHAPQAGDPLAILPKGGGRFAPPAPV
jgi:hypothetical protein